MHWTITEKVMGIIVILALGYDLYALLSGGIRNTISWQLKDLSKKYPSIPLFIGFLCGHWFGAASC